MLLTGMIVFAFLASAAAEQRVAIPLGDSPALGPENAPVTVVEFIDFQ